MRRETEESSDEYEAVHLDETFAHLWDDDAAVAAARAHLANAPIGVKGNGRHPAALRAFMRCLDLGATPETALDLMLELWSPLCIPPYVDRAELEKEICGVELARQNPIGYRHPNAFETPPSEDENRPITPPHDAPPVDMDFLTLDEAEKRLRAIVMAAIDKFFDWDLRRSGSDCPVYGVPAVVGLGKTEVALKAIVGALIQMRRRKNKKVVVLAAPTHRLSEELEERFNAIDDALVQRLQQQARKAGMLPRTVERIGREARLTAATWRGREADEPSGSGEKMCKNLDAVKKGAGAGARR